jgi:HD-GYP domain-containing protein (c-di-GMP phosphodiesterase class II)
MIELGALVHDLGKVSVPAEILARPGRLNPLELALVREHATLGQRALGDTHVPEVISQIAGQHHERLDGSGYPLQLRGDEIALAARIVAVADVLEAMAHDRPYRAALGRDAGVDEITRGAGSLYDPQVVDACLRVLASGFRFEV